MLVGLRVENLEDDRGVRIEAKLATAQRCLVLPGVKGDPVDSRCNEGTRLHKLSRPPVVIGDFLSNEVPGVLTALHKPLQADGVHRALRTIVELLEASTSMEPWPLPSLTSRALTEGHSKHALPDAKHTIHTNISNLARKLALLEFLIIFSP